MSKIKVQADSVSDEGFLPALQTVTSSLHLHMIQKEKRWLSSVFYYKTTSPV
jgi:hypothetical protein